MRSSSTRPLGPAERLVRAAFCWIVIWIQTPCVRHALETIRREIRFWRDVAAVSGCGGTQVCAIRTTVSQGSKLATNQMNLRSLSRYFFVELSVLIDGTLGSDDDVNHHHFTLSDCCCGTSSADARTAAD